MTTSTGLNRDAIAFVTQAQRDARKAFRALRETRTVSASGTLQLAARIPGEEKLVHINYPSPWEDELESLPTAVIGYDGVEYWGGTPRGGETRYVKLFQRHADVRAVAHIHTPHLGAYSQAHAVLPLLYVPNRRFRVTPEIPVYIDRRQEEVDFILEAIEHDRDVPAIVEANGGATAWSRKGILDLTETIILLEEGAQFQLLAAALGGPKPFGPGVLTQQWRMGKLIPPTATVDEDGRIHSGEAAE